MRPAAPAYAYAAVSLSNVVATLCQYEALKYLTFPLQVRAVAKLDVRPLAHCVLASHGPQLGDRRTVTSASCACSTLHAAFRQ